MFSSNIYLFFIFFSIIAMVSYILINIKIGKGRLINNLYMALSACLILWLVALIPIKYVDLNETWLYIWDAVTNIAAAYVPVIALILARAFVNNSLKIKIKKYWPLFIIPTITVIMVWTNPLHHLHYRVFSTVASLVEFGPYIYISAIYSYSCLVVSTVTILRFGISTNRFYLKQSLAFCVGNLIPMIVSLIATLKILNLDIAATPISFVGTWIFHGIAFLRFKFLDITPLAMQSIMDRVSDCYIIVSDGGLVVDFNQPFHNVFAKQCELKPNMYLEDVLKKPGSTGIDVMYNLYSTIEQCSISSEVIYYEQDIQGEKGKNYYFVEIVPLFNNEATAGYFGIFKDVTSLKADMAKLQNTQSMIMERERLASLGQMIGGIAHNLKTPIMSISGNTMALETLANEYLNSINDSAVTIEDHKEIAAEMLDWLGKIRVACSYMSDIITTVKDQATRMNASYVREFSLDELFKRVGLLMRNELISKKCQLSMENTFSYDIFLVGDINNLVQVLNNLISNAVDAYEDVGGEIVVKGEKKDDMLLISVKDFGKGVSPEVKSHLFKEMITDKGTKGTGLGLYMSNVVLRGKFGGEMWLEDNPVGGTIFYLGIPMKNVKIYEGSVVGQVDIPPPAPETMNQTIENRA